jgi:hypothetical protein
MLTVLSRSILRKMTLAGVGGQVERPGQQLSMCWGNQLSPKCSLAVLSAVGFAD